MKKRIAFMVLVAGLVLAGRLPAEVIFADDFNRADGNLAGTSTSVGGYAWVASVGGGTAFKIHNGQVEVTPSSLFTGVVVQYNLDKVLQYTVSFDLIAKAHNAGTDKTHLHYHDRFNFSPNEEWYGYVASYFEGAVWCWFSPSWADISAQAADAVMHVSILNQGNISTWTINSTTYDSITIYAQANDGITDNVCFGAYSGVDVGMVYIIDNLVVEIVREPTYLTFSPASGTYDEAQTAVITCQTTDAAIYYTTDGSDPSPTNGTQIVSGGSVSVDHSLTLKAIAVVNDAAGSVYQAAYVIIHQNAIFNVPSVDSLNIDGNLNDWPAAATWSQPYIYWYGTGLTSETRAKFAWNDAADMLYVAIETDEASVQPGGHAVVGFSKDIAGIPNNGIGSTQLCFDPVAGSADVTIRNEIDYYTRSYGLGWPYSVIDGVQAKYSFDGTYYTYEIAIPLWNNWQETYSPRVPQELTTGDVVYLYTVMESGLETTNGTNMTWDGHSSNPLFYNGAFNKAAALTLAQGVAPTITPTPTPTPTAAPIPGDANHDNKVDVSDLGILAANYGTISGAEWIMGDFNGDHVVDVSDLGILAANYGTGTGAALDFNADATALGLSAEADTPATSALGCTPAGLPLIAGLLLMSLLITKLDE